MSKKGILIAVEGMDGSGKSTQAKLLYHWLRAKGLPVFHTEWNSSKIVKQATKIGKNTRRLLPITFHMIHAADFADRWAQQIEPVLEIGGIVICDRYKYTAMARDGSRDVPREVIEDTYSFAREPDLTLYFDVPVDVSFDRIAKVGHGLDNRPIRVLQDLPRQGVRDLLWAGGRGQDRTTRCRGNRGGGPVQGQGDLRQAHRPL